MLKYLTTIILLLMSAVFPVSAQEKNAGENQIEIFIIDSYVTPEKPHMFVLSFFTTDSCRSKVKLEDRYEFDVSKEFTDNHKISIDLTKLKIDSAKIKYTISAFGRDGSVSRSQIYEVGLPEGITISPENDPGLLLICLGGVVFGLPSPAYVNADGKEYLGLSKEIPLFSFYKGGYNYPFGYVSLEYSHILKAERKNFLRVGYKQIIQTPLIEFVSPGADYFTDFRGFNGLSAEISAGLFKIGSVFTLYARYRYNFQPSENKNTFYELSIGLYSSFFSLNL